MKFRKNKKSSNNRKVQKKQKNPKGSKDQKASRQKSNTVSGTVSIAHRGYGFVSPSNKQQFKEDIFIPKKYLQGAADGDMVLVVPNEQISPKGPEGRVIKILKRKHSTLVGIVIRNSAHPKSPKFPYTVFAPLLGKHKLARISSSKKLQIGDRICLKIVNWNLEDEPLEGTFSQYLGHINDASTDIKAAVLEFGLSENFSENVIQEVLAYHQETINKESKNRKDYTLLNTITIDPTTAKDFDDALSLEKDPKGHFHLGVHIADVSYFVPIASELNHEALKRGNSTYFPGFCLPMLPKELSNDLCSLKENVLRLSISVMMEFDGDGELINYQIQKATIKNKKRFTYEEAFAVLQKKQKSDFFEELQNMQKLCLLLKEKRKTRGSIEFSLPSAEIIVDKQGEPQKINLVEYDISHQLVEEFMLKANELVAEHLKKQGKMLIYRTHEKPDPEALDSFFELAKSLGFSLPPNPGHKDIQKLFLEAQNSPLLSQLSISYIRSMKLAVYSPENMGHYGLALEHYCHFTSPIRRYSDLIIHRLLFNEEQNLDLHEIADKCSSAERKSFKAEMSVVNLKKLRLLQKLQKQDPKKTYKAVISKIKPYFIIFEVTELFLEGSVHLSELEDDFYIYDPFEDALTGEDSNHKFSYGDKIKVKPKKIDLKFLEVQWRIF